MDSTKNAVPAPASLLKKPSFAIVLGALADLCPLCPAATVSLTVQAGRPGAETVLAGVAGIDPKATSMVLAGGSLTDVISFEEPRKVAPVESRIDVAGPRFQRSFVPHSLMVLRLRERQKNGRTPRPNTP